MKPKTSRDKPETPNRVGPMRLSGDVDESYQCVMVNPPKSKMLKSRKYKLICEAVKVEGFSRDENSKETPNGISCVIPTKVIGIQWPKKRNRRGRRQPNETKT